MDSIGLRVFAAVARSGSMNRAADELHTVQSNVTRRIRALESELGVELFARHSRGVDLTDAGRRLLSYAEDMCHLLDDAERAARDDGIPAGPLRIGSLETTAAIRLPAVLASYTRSNPAVDLTLVTDTTAGLVARVLAHELHGAFVCGPIVHPELHEEPIFEEELVLVTAPDVADLSQLAGDADLRIVVFRVGCSYRQRLESLLADRGFRASRTLEFGTVDGILGCVAAGIGVTLLPRSVVRPAAVEGRVAAHEIADDRPWVSTVFIRPADRFVSSALTRFVDVARAHYAGTPDAAGTAPASPVGSRKTAVRPAPMPVSSH